MRSITTVQYPLEVASIRPSWGAWETIREIQQEFMDLSMSWYKVSQRDGKTIWEGDTPQFELPALIIAKSLKRERGMDTIGRFGDGTVHAMAVALRLGWEPILHSHNFVIHPTLKTIVMDDTPVGIMEIEVLEADEALDHTRYEITYAGELFQDHFVSKDAKPLSSHDGVDLYQGQGFFCKGVWVSDNSLDGIACRYAYNFADLKLTEDRSIADSYDLKARLVRFWKNETDRALLETFWAAVRDGTAGESNLWFSYVEPNPVTKEVIRSLWGDAVVATDTYWKGQAEYLKGNVVTFSNNLATLMQKVFPTDKDYARQMGSSLGSRALRTCDLTPDEDRRLKLLQRVAQRITPGIKIKVAVMEPGGLSNGRSVTIAHHVLAKGDQDAMAVLLHELAHDQSDASDATARMVDAVAGVAARVILSYACPGCIGGIP